MTEVIAGERGLLARSLWAATAGPAPDCPALEGEARADVAVVGAGYTGLSAAIHLAERGLSVAVLEAESPGWGASGRNGGQVIAGLKEDAAALRARFGPEVGGRLARFAAAAPEVVFDLIDRHAIDCDDARNGWLQPAHDAASLARQRARAAALRAEGAPADLLDADETARLTGAAGYAGALLDRRGGSVQPLKYARGLAHAAQRLGVAIHGDSRVTGLELAGGSRAGGGLTVVTARGRVEATHVLLCLNGYADGLHDRLRRSVVPVVSVQVASAPLSANLRATILPDGRTASELRRLPVYYRMSPDGRLVIGGRGAYGDAGLARQIARLRAVAGRMFPQLGPVDWPFHWGGFVAMTTDHLPHLHDLEPGVTAALGYNGRGVAMATAMGRALADRVTHGPAAALEAPATPLAPIPFHALRGPAVSAVVAWNGLRDRLGT